MAYRRSLAAFSLKIALLGGLCLPWVARAQSLPAAPEAPQAPRAPALQMPSPSDAARVGADGVVVQPGDNMLLQEGQGLKPGGPDVSPLDPPGRAGRVRVLKGHGALLAQGQNEWIDAASNRPLTAGDALWVDARGRAMVQLGSTTLYLDSHTAVTVTALDAETVHLTLTMGQIFVHLGPADFQPRVQVDTPGLAAALRQGGDYGLRRQPDGADTLTVWLGAAEVERGGQHVAVGPGQKLVSDANPTADGVPSAAGKPNSFESFCRRNSAKADRAPALRYVSQETVGYDDLDRHGTWATTPDYGALWIPNSTSRAWAPYRYGHWAYILPWGWTWVDDAPWGFAPFHYGRWVFWRKTWAWAPGAPRHRPVYAPHLVTFVQGGAQSGLGAGQVGWVPLGYGDPFQPGYAASPTYLRQINGAFDGALLPGGHHPAYSNGSIQGAVTIVPLGALTGGAALGGLVLPLGAQGLGGPGIWGGALPPVQRPPQAGIPRGARAPAVRPPQGVWPAPIRGGQGGRPLFLHRSPPDGRFMGGPQHGMPQHGMPQHGMPQHGMPQHGMPQHGMPQHDGPAGGYPGHGGPRPGPSAHGHR